MNAHFLVRDPRDGDRCCCGSLWPCLASDRSLLYADNLSVGPEAGKAGSAGSQPYKYMIGQRAIYQNVIVTICATPEYYGRVNDDTEIWIDNPERDYKHYVDIKNLKPLPNGQL